MPEEGKTEQRSEEIKPKSAREPSQYETAMMIADQLGETSDPARKYIVYVVRVLGRTQSRRLHKEALSLEESGGMMTPDGERRRTPSEVFFHLAESRGNALSPFESKPASTEEPATHWEVAQQIAQRLNETEVQQQRQIEHIVWALGQEQTLTFMQEAIAIDEGEGMLVPSGSRRRTVGGIFFYLVYNRGVPLEGRTLKRASGQEKKPAQTLPRVGESIKEPQVILVWKDRIAAIREAETQKGTANVKITVVGRPGKIVDKGTCIVTVMESTKVPALPKGLPTPPSTATKYTVYIGAKQWKKVAEAIADPEDVLIVEGFPTVDAEMRAIAVFATNTTTKKLQMAQKTKGQEAATS
jgi:PHAX RNA-binding domain